MQAIETRAFARVGFLGNPSDLCGGKGLGFTVRDFACRLRLERAPERHLESDLLRAGWNVFKRHVSGSGLPLDEIGFEITFGSDVPLQAGLAGSSAILVAELRALARLFELELEPATLAELALRAEIEGLGIRAGPLDRLVQAHEGLLFMDFAHPFAEGSIRRLPVAALPLLLITWHPDPGEPSGDVHTTVWDRWEAGEREVREVMAAFAPLAEAGLEALGRGDHRELIRLVDRNFDLRARLFSIGRKDREMIELGRSFGCGTKFCGSGGSVLVVAPDRETLERCEAGYRHAGFRTCVPEVREPEGAA